jgi:osmotically-inducible protein OsmY
MLRELREDASTTASGILVNVEDGNVDLAGRVPSISDAGWPRKCRARVPGLADVSKTSRSQISFGLERDPRSSDRW